MAKDKSKYVGIVVNKIRLEKLINKVVIEKNGCWSDSMVFFHGMCGQQKKKNGCLKCWINELKQEEPISLDN